MGGNSAGKCKSFYLLIAALSLLSSCRLAQRTLQNEQQLIKNEVNIAESHHRRFVSSDVEAAIKQKPNKKFLGIARLSVWFYRLGSLSAHDNGFYRFLRYKLGESPVLLDTSTCRSSITVIRNTLRTYGFYYPEIAYSVREQKILWLFKNKKRMIVSYNIHLNQAYRINEVNLNVADKKIYQFLLARMNDSYLVRGKDIHRADLLEEQTRLTDLIRNHGYYLFNKDFIEFDVDTALNSYHCNIGINIRCREDFQPHRQFRIHRILAELDSVSLSKGIYDRDTFTYGKLVYVPHNNKVHPAVIDRMIVFEKDSLFSQRRLNNSFNRLNDLQLFKTISFNPVVHDTGEVGTLDFNISLNPLKKYDLTLEPQSIISDQSNLFTGNPYQNYGLAMVVQLNDRNIFHNGEIFQVRLRSAVEAQQGSDIRTSPFFNSYEQSVTTSLIIPKLLFISYLDKKFSNSTTRTAISASVIYETNVDYRRNVFTTGLSWQFSKRRITYTLAPFEVSYIRTQFANSNLESQSNQNFFLQNIFANNLVTDMRFGFIYSNQTLGKNHSFYYLRWDAFEIGGNIINAFNRYVLDAPKNDKGHYEFFGVNYFQYAKSYFDFRYNFVLDVNNTIVTRLATGVAYPYGNSPDFVPYEKRFFTGGANSNRAFIPRSIGPGSYSVPNQLDHSGDVKVESNVEYRFNIYKHLFNGAIFADAGNVWTVKDDGRPGAQFKFDQFYNQLAIGAGSGIRLSISVLILRVDAGFPILDPRKPFDDRWVISNISQPAWIWHNALYNFAVGYPF